MVLGDCCLWGRRQGGGRAGQSASQPPPSAITLPHTPGAGHHDTNGFVFTSQSPENWSFHSAHGPGYQFGPASSQCSLGNCASVSPLEPALPNPPLFPSTPEATSPAPACVEMGATHGGAAFAASRCRLAPCASRAFSSTLSRTYPYSPRNSGGFTPQALSASPTCGKLFPGCQIAGDGA